MQVVIAQRILGWCGSSRIDPASREETEHLFDERAAWIGQPLPIRDRGPIERHLTHVPSHGYVEPDEPIPASSSRLSILFTACSIRSSPSFDSALPWWIKIAENTTNEKSCRNSDCQFSRVD